LPQSLQQPRCTAGFPSYDRAVIWEPFVLALVLGVIVSAGLYFAYLWPSVEPEPIEELPDEPPQGKP
jgi:hypothetical protein